MADEPEDHYQPWLRNTADEGSRGAVARPAPLPTTAANRRSPARGSTRDSAAGESEAGATISRGHEISADELLARPTALPTPPVAGPDWQARASDALGRFADWTIRLGEQADIPARVARLELGRRGTALARAAARGVAAGARQGRKAAEGALAATGRAGEAAVPHLRAAADTARAGLAKGVDGARSGLSAGTQAAGGAARKLAEAAPLPLIGAKAEPVVESQLARLLAEEAQAQAANPAAGAKGRPAPSALPLFSEPAAPPAPRARKGSKAAAAEVMASDAVTDPVEAAPLPGPPPAAAPAMTTTRPSPSPARAALDGPWLRHPATWALGAVALLATGFAAGSWWSGSSANGAANAAMVREAILANPGIIPEAMQKLESDAAAAAIGRLRSAIERPWSGAWAGAADGDVTLTVFTDYNCTFCRASVPDIDRLLREDRRLKIVFRELPILSPDSDAAARLALVAAKRGRYMAVHRALFASGNPNATARTAVATQFGLPADAAALGDPAIGREIEANLDTARALGFDGTPSWVIGNRVLKGAVGYDQLRAAIAAARAG